MSEATNANNSQDEQLQAIVQINTLQSLTEDATEFNPASALPEPLLPHTETEALPERGRLLSRPSEVKPAHKQEGYLSPCSSANKTPTICAICHKALENRTKVNPCDHVFDLECLSTWLAQSGRGSRKCPLCRRAIEEIHHIFDGQGGITSQVINVMEEEGAFPDDEATAPNMSERDRHAALEHRRLRVRTPLLLQDAAQYVNICVREDDHDVRIERNITLEIEQRSLATTSKIIRTVQIKYTDHSHRRWPLGWDNSYKNMLELEKTKREVARMTNRWLSPCLEVQEGTFVLHNVEIPRGERGIRSFLKGKVTIVSTSRDPKSIKIVWETTIEEEGPANASNDPEIFSTNARSESRTRREEHIANAMDQMQGVLEWFQMREQDVSVWFMIDRTTTNILEARRSDLRCRYCHQGHRNGDCLLPWEHVR